VLMRNQLSDVKADISGATAKLAEKLSGASARSKSAAPKSAAASQGTPFDGAMAAFRKVLIVTAVFSMFINMLMFIGPIHMMQVYDRVLSSRSIGTLVMLTAICGFLLITYMLLDMFRSRILVRAGVEFDETLRGPLFRAALKSSLTNRNSSATQVLRDMDVVRETFTGAAFITLCDAPFAIVFALICFMMHWMLGVVALGGAVVLFCLALANERSTRDGLKEAGKAGNEASYFVTTSVRNIEVIQALGMSQTIEKRWTDRHLDHLGWQAQASDRAGIILSSTKAFRQFLQIAILGVGAYLAINREISPGLMVAASIMMGRALAPVEQAVGQWKAFINARAAIERIQGLLKSVTADVSRTQLEAPVGALAAEGLVAVAPKRQQPILKGVSFDLAAGQTLAVIGPSGSGKSTLARALIGVWPISHGTARIDGADIRHWDQDRLGTYLGYLPQDVELFAGTITQNIARLQLDADDLDVIKAAKLSGVHDFIQTLPDGYDTQIGEGGVTLSGGQRQRIGLARAFFGKPKLVVLDEPNAHLDAAGETELLHAIRRAKAEGITIVLITHKPNLLVAADRVLLLHDGAVRKFGTPQEIMQELAGPRPADPRSTQGAVMQINGPQRTVPAKPNGVNGGVNGGANGDMNGDHGAISITAAGHNGMANGSAKTNGSVPLPDDIKAKSVA
jgi:PrtD family type I secretion system ABC transporter